MTTATAMIPTDSFETKSAKVRRLFSEGNREEALKIAKGFKMGLSRKDRAVLQRGYECLWNPEFYQKLGYDPEKEVAKAMIVCSTI